MQTNGNRTETATFAMGCFWTPEVVFRNVEGVADVRVGYTGGWVPNPTYELVCTGGTGHAEAVRVTFDPERVSFAELMEVFLNEHDPTQVNRQGPDVGTQYRSAVFAHSPEQRAVAQEALERAANRFPRPIATEVVEASPFYEAEEYHQQYLVRRGLATCRV